MAVDLEELSPDKFEDLCNTLLRREVGAVKSIEGAGGDRGVDGFKGEIEGEIVIYQHKFYTGRLSDKSGRKRSILNSYNTAKEHHPELKKWVLLIATELTHKEQEWFEQEIKSTDNDIEVDYWNKLEIEDRLQQYNDLVHRFFPESVLSLSQKNEELINYLSGTPIDRARRIGKHLDEIQEENPNLGLEYTFSSEDNTAEVKLDPDIPIRIGTRLKVGEEKLEKIKQREKVRFTANEIDDIEFNIDNLIGDDFEPSELVVKPWYEDWERDAQIEIPGGRFRKELALQIEDLSDTAITLKTQDSIFSITIESELEGDEADWCINAEFDDEPVYKISEFLDFIDQLEENEAILLRELEDGNPVFNGKIDSEDLSSDLAGFQSLIEELQVIESHTGCSILWTNNFEDNFEIDIKIAKDLLTDGEAQWPYTLSASAIQIDKDALEQFHKGDNESQRITVEVPEFGVTIMDQEIELGDVWIEYPDPELNIDEILEWSEESEPIPIELRPSNQAEIILQDQN